MGSIFAAPYSKLQDSPLNPAFAVQNDVVQLLIENEANVNLATADNWTPVHDAARAGHVSVLRTLLAANADMQVTYVNKYFSLQNLYYSRHKVPQYSAVAHITRAPPPSSLHGSRVLPKPAERLGAAGLG